MKNAHFVLLLLMAVLFSCSEAEQDGDWDDNIGLSQKEVQLSSSEDSIVITTKQVGWWINEVSLNGTRDFEPTENANGNFLLDEEGFFIERRSPKELYVEMSPNATGSERKLRIGLQNGNYFDGVIIIQAGQ